MDKPSSSKLLAILAPIILIIAAILGVIFPRMGLWLILGTIVLLAFIGSRLKR